MLSRALVVSVVFIVAGCSSFQGKTATELAAMSAPDILNGLARDRAIGAAPSEAAIDALAGSGAVTEEDIQDIRAHRVRVGMDEAVARASWGNPRRINSSSSWRGKTWQYVYADSDELPWAYVSIGEDGRVRAIDKFGR